MIQFKDFLKAATDGNLEVVQQYIEENKNDINAINKGRDDYDEGFCHRIGDTALMCAACWGHFDVVKTLLSVKGIDINAVNSTGDTALMYAARASYYTYCIAPGSNGNTQGHGGREISIDEARKSYLNIVNALLDTHAIHDIDAFDCNGYTALMHAVKNGFVDLIETILNADANTKLRCNPQFGMYTPLDWKESMGKTAEEMAKDRLQYHSATYWQGKREHEDNEIIKLLKQQNSPTKAARAVTKNIQYIQDNLPDFDPNMLKEPIFAIANLFATDEQYENISHQLYEVAADLGHDAALRIVKNFKNVEVKIIESNENENNELKLISNFNQVKLSPLTPPPIGRIQEARLKFFDKLQQNPCNKSSIVNVMDNVSLSKEF